MNEYIEVRFRRNGKPFPLKRQLPGGVEFDEPDPCERTVGVTFDAASAATRERMNSIRRVQGWDPGQFKLNISVEDGALILRGANEHALPEGLYRLKLEIEEARTPGRFTIADVAHDRHAVVHIDVQLDERGVKVDLDDCDADIRQLLDRSKIEDVAASAWLEDASRRPTRQACLLNLLASLRTRPTPRTSLVQLVHDVYYVGNDRIYAKVDRSLVDLLRTLASDATKPFYAEGSPNAPIHGRLLSGLPEPPEVRTRFTALESFRGEGKPSMQAVIAIPPPDLPYTYAEFDLDLGNPLQDVLGFFVHMGELLDGKPTNHLDMRKVLAKAKASEFLYYTVVANSR
jgi:hypothetical protein